MDRILVMDRGRILEEGTYAELASKGGIFTSMLASERGSVEELNNTTTDEAAAVG